MFSIEYEISFLEMVRGGKCLGNEEFLDSTFFCIGFFLGIAEACVGASTYENVRRDGA